MKIFGLEFNTLGPLCGSMKEAGMKVHLGEAPSDNGPRRWWEES